MDYESRQIKWYWVLLFSLYCGAVIFILFSENPYLYSRQELRNVMTKGEVASVLRIPAQPLPNLKPGAPTFFSRYNFSRTGVDPLGAPRSKNYDEYQQYRVQHGIEGFDIQHISQDASGFYLAGR